MGKNTCNYVGERASSRRDRKAINSVARKLAKGPYALQDAKVPRKQVSGGITIEVPVKTVKQSHATLLFSSPEFNFKGTIKRAIKEITCFYRYTNARITARRPYVCSHCRWNWSKHQSKCAVAALLADLETCLQYGRPS